MYNRRSKNVIREKGEEKNKNEIRKKEEKRSFDSII